MVLSTEWSQVEVIDLQNDGNGFGFILVGGKSTGVVIKALTPGGIAERDGRMQCGDHVLQIGEVNLRGFTSEQAATVLRQTGAQVRLIVARPVEPTSPDYQALASHAPIIPTKFLTDPDELERQLLQSAAISGPFFSAQDAVLQANAAAAAELQLNEEYIVHQQQLIQQHQQHQQQQQQQQQQSQRNSLMLSPCSLNAPILYSPTSAPCQLYGCSGSNGDGGGVTCSDYDSESSAGGATGGGCGPPSSSAVSPPPETEIFDVVLHRNVYGLGIRVAGYVCEEEDLSGIFVKSMVEGGAGEAGRVRINDRILAVDGRSVTEATNHEAVTLLKNSGISVHLRVERFLRGRKYEHLQVALNDMKEVNICTAASTAATTPAAARQLPSMLSMDADMSCASLATTNRRQMVGSDTMTSLAQLSMPPSPSCATLTWVAPRSDADSLATVDIDYPDVVFDDKQIEDEFDAHTTVGSDLVVVHHNAKTNSGSQAPTPTPPLETLFDQTKTRPCPTKATTTTTAAAALEGPPQQRKSSSKRSLSPISPPPPPMNVHTKSPTSRRLQSPGAATTAPSNNKINPADTPTTAKRTATQTDITSDWRLEYPGSQIIVAQLNKLAGLGISLEGTVDVEGGIEKRPHHYIRSILNDGPVAVEGSLRPGDEILEVNEHRLQGLRHVEVVKILKELPAHVRMVCARGPSAPSVINTSQNLEAFQSRSILPGGLGPRELAGGQMRTVASAGDALDCSGCSVFGAASSSMLSPKFNVMTKALSEGSLYTSSTATGCALSDELSGSPPMGFHRQHRLGSSRRHRSVERVSGMALWCSEVTYVELCKTEKGFGFSVLDYQDPMDEDGTVIVVRGLIKGGAAESSQRLHPGDRIISVGGVRVQGKTLDEAVDVLKGMPLGNVQIGLCRPLSSTSDDSTDCSLTPT